MVARNITPTRPCESCGKPVHQYPSFRGNQGQFCSRTCRYGFETFEERFWTKVNQTDTCWLWTASTNGVYGVLGVKRDDGWTNELAHRIAYRLTKGDIPQNGHILHSCNTPLCCNPDHLRVGDPSQNHEDMILSGHSTYGEKNPQAKLKESDVIEIRRLYAIGTKLQRIADIFGIHYQQAFRIAKRKQWKHI